MNKFILDAQGALSHFIADELRALVPAANVAEYPPYADHLKASKRAAAAAADLARGKGRSAAAGGVVTAKPRKKAK